MDKVRSILLAFEAREKPYFLALNPDLLGDVDSAQEMVEYLQMLASGGLLEVSQRSTYRISWAGHDFIDSIRDPDIWRQTKEGAGKLGSWTVSLLADLAKGLIIAKAKAMGLPLG